MGITWKRVTETKPDRIPFVAKTCNGKYMVVASDRWLTDRKWWICKYGITEFAYLEGENDLRAGDTRLSE